MAKAVRVTLLLLALACPVSAGETPNNVAGVPAAAQQQLAAQDETPSHLMAALIGALLNLLAAAP